MGISILKGGICSGKSKICLDMIERVHNENPNAKCIMIVPDHYSYETEKMFVQKFSGTGINNIDVVTLRRMAINYLSAKRLNHLTESGKQIILYKAVNNACEEIKKIDGMDMKLISAMKKPGFLDIASSLVSEMKRYLILPQMLKEQAETITDNNTLKNKLIALSAVYERYIQYVDESGCTDSEDDLFELASVIENGSDFDSNTYIWVNRFDRFMPQQLCVLESLLKRGVHMTVSICYGLNDDENYIYESNLKTVNSIEQLAAIYGLEGELTAGESLSHLKKDSALYSLLKNWTGDTVYDLKTDDISMFQSIDTYGEIERIACKIGELIREDGYRYRDIALLCGDEEEYRHVTEAVFTEYGIPYFTDRKIILSDHPIAMQILSLFGLIEDDWNYDSVFRYLRAGFIYRKKGSVYKPINQSEVDILENFVLKYGIRGKNKWSDDKPWTNENDILSTAFGMKTEEKNFEVIENLRREIAAPALKFSAAVKGKKTAEEFATALFEYLCDINLYRGLKGEISSFNKKGMLNEGEQFTKIWNLILDVLDQAVTALGNEVMNISEFADYMAVGLSKCEIRIIPSGIDQVYVGSVERSSHSKVKAMFIVGAKNGTFPTGIKTEGFLSDNDRNILDEKYGIKIAPDTKKKMNEQYFKVYRALCAVSEKLFISYSVQDSDGRSISPSHIVNDIIRRFPKIKISDNLIENSENDKVYLSTPQATIHKMLINLSSRYDGDKNPLWDIVYDWYKNKGEWKKILSLIKRADYYDKRGIMLDSDIANMLYGGKVTYSASRINTFASCPFEYFIKYGLGASVREEWSVNPANMGSYAHQIIHEFCKIVEEGAESNEEKIEKWRNLTDKNRQDILEEIVNLTCENMLNSNVRDKERTAAIFKRMGRTVSYASKLVQKSLSAGNFAEYGMEFEFETDISEKVRIKGIIDRIDTCQTKDGDVYIRIIDYKTGSTNFDIVNIANGYNMQMILYALAAAKIMKEEGKNPKVAGVYYTSVRDVYITADATVSDEVLLDSGGNDMAMDGLSFVSEREEDRDKLFYNMDTQYIQNGEIKHLNIVNKRTGLSGYKTDLEINGLMRHVQDTVVNMDDRIRNGEIQLSPYISNSNGGVCAYCDYKAVCKFDEKNCVGRVPEGTSKEAWEKMKNIGAMIKEEEEDA